jgi:hypothetical protein
VRLAFTPDQEALQRELREYFAYLVRDIGGSSPDGGSHYKE